MLTAQRTFTADEIAAITRFPRKHTEELTIQITMVFGFCRYDSRNKHEVSLLTYHASGGFHNCQFIGFFDNTTPPREYNLFSVNRHPYFIRIPFVNINLHHNNPLIRPLIAKYKEINTVEEYHHTYSNDEILFLGKVNRHREIVYIRDLRGEAIDNPERDVDNPLHGEHVLIANMELPIISIVNINISNSQLMDIYEQKNPPTEFLRPYNYKTNIEQKIYREILENLGSNRFGDILSKDWRIITNGMGPFTQYVEQTTKEIREYNGSSNLMFIIDFTYSTMYQFTYGLPINSPIDQLGQLGGNIKKLHIK